LWVFLREYAHEIALSRRLFTAQNAANIISGRAPPGSARGTYSTPPDPLPELKGPTSKGRGGDRKEG